VLGLLTESDRTWDISNAYQFYRQTNHLLFYLSFHYTNYRPAYIGIRDNITTLVIKIQQTKEIRTKQWCHFLWQRSMIPLAAGMEKH
jgi:hypothetical protein